MRPNSNINNLENADPIQELKQILTRKTVTTLQMSQSCDISMKDVQLSLL